MVCPKCGFEQLPGSEACPSCGIVFAKVLAREAAAPPVPLPDRNEADPEERPGVRGIAPDGWKALGIGGAVAVGAMLVPFLRFIVSYFVILIHEFGHAAAGWAFGYPSIPAFDFGYGGGVTFHEDRRIALVLLVYAAIAVAAWLLRSRRRALIVLGVLVVAYSVVAWTPLHEALQIFMGHGTELVIAGIFLYRAASGTSLVVPAERPIYGFLGFFTLLYDFRFAFLLVNSPEERMLYEDAKGGGHWMDFSRLAEEYLGASVPTVAGIFFLLCLATPILAWSPLLKNQDIHLFRVFGFRPSGRDGSPGLSSLSPAPRGRKR